MRKLIAQNRGGGQRPDPVPRASLSKEGYLTLNMTADQMIEGARWNVEYEEDSNLAPAFILSPATATNAGAYKVIRGTGSAAKIKIKALWNESNRADKFVGKYTVTKVSNGIRLDKERSRGS